MKRILYIIAAVACLLAAGTDARAQLDEREPGIYAIVGEQSVPLKFTNGVIKDNSTDLVGIDIGNEKYVFRGATSGVVAPGTFVLVIDPERKTIVKTLNKYNPFVQTVTPENVLIIPLDVVRKKRVYNTGVNVMGIIGVKWDCVEFEWKQISDNSYEIRFAEAPAPGEYGFVFRISRIAAYDFTGLYGFTIR